MDTLVAGLRAYLLEHFPDKIDCLQNNSASNLLQLVSSRMVDSHTFTDKLTGTKCGQVEVGNARMDTLIAGLRAYLLEHFPDRIDSAGPAHPPVPRTQT